MATIVQWSINGIFSPSIIHFWIFGYLDTKHLRRWDSYAAIGEKNGREGIFVGDRTLVNISPSIHAPSPLMARISSSLMAQEQISLEYQCEGVEIL